MFHRSTPIIVSAAAAVLLFAVMSSLADFPLVDTMWRASAPEIYRAVSALTAAQVRAYRAMLAVDFFYALAYTGLLVLLLRLFETNQRFCSAIRRAGIAAAGTAGLADYLENALILAVLRALPEKSSAARALGIVTTVKWIAVATAVTIILVMVVLRSSERRQR